MPALSWNEIRQRAFQFSLEWKGVKAERAEAQTFWNEFFAVFGIRRRMVQGGDIIICNRPKTLCAVPEIGIGNKPIDGGNYLFNHEEKDAFVTREPGAEKFFRPWIGSVEFLHGYHRWCLWLGDASPQELRELPECRKRIEAVRELRLKSKTHLLQLEKLSTCP